MARGLKGIKQRHPLGSVAHSATSRTGISPLVVSASGAAAGGVKISALPAATAASDSDQMEVNQGGVSKRLTLEQVASLVGTELDGDYLPLAGGTLSGGLSGTTTTMSDNIASTGGNITTQGGNITIDRTGDATSADMYIGADAGFLATLNFRTASTLRWVVRKNSTVEGGSNAGSDFEILARTDAGGALSTPLTITRSTGAVALTGALTGTSATMTGNITTTAGVVAAQLISREGAGSGVVADTFGNNLVVDSDGSLGMTFTSPNTQSPSIFFKDPEASSGAISYAHSTDTMGFSTAGANRLSLTAVQATFTGGITTNGGNVLVDRTADAAAAAVDLRADNGQVAHMDFRTAALTRWRFQKTNGVETSPTNVGSDLALTAYDDAGASLGNAFLITRATRAISLGGALSGTTAAFSGAVTSVTAAPGTNTTQLASTAFVQAALTGSYQTVSYQTGAVATGTTIMPFDDTIPQITEGDEYMTLAITPKSATSKLNIDVTLTFSHTAVNNFVAALFQDSTANALAAATWSIGSATAVYQMRINHTMTSGTTSATTFKVRAGCGVAGTTTFNGSSGNRFMGGVMASSIVIKEVAS